MSSSITPPRGELRALLVLAAPLAAAHAGNHLISLVDAAILGHYSETAQGAAGLANNLFFAFSVVGLGVMMSLDPLVSQAIGAKQLGRARTLLWQGVWLSFVVGLFISVPIAVTPLFFGVFGLDPEIARDTAIYLWLRIPGLWPLLLFSGLRNYLQANNKAFPMILATIISNLVNAFTAPLLVFGGNASEQYVFGEMSGLLSFVPPLGIRGAAIAASFCMLIQALVLLLFTSRIKTAEAFTRKPVKEEVSKALRVGVPIGLQLMAEVGAFALAGLIAGGFGKVPLAAHQIALTWASFTFSMALGVSSAGAVMVGNAVGEQDQPKIRRAGVHAFLVGGGVMFLSSLLFWIFPREIVSLLSNKEEVIAATISLLGVAAVFQVFDGLQVTGAGVLRGAADTKSTFVINIIGHYLLGLPTGLVLGVWFGIGVVGLWWGLCVGLVSVGLLLFWRFWRITSKPIERI